MRADHLPRGGIEGEPTLGSPSTFLSGLCERADTDPYDDGHTLNTGRALPRVCVGHLSRT